jgi:CheY-like chemotaxis protein
MAEKKKILLLDDSLIALELARAALAERGYEVALAANLIEFQAALDAFQPEIILTDLVMPDVSGKDIVRVLKQDFHTERIPIVLFSSKGDAELAEIAEQAGADGYLSKSHGLERLGELVDELVDAIIW